MLCGRAHKHTVGQRPLFGTIGRSPVRCEQPDPAASAGLAARLFSAEVPRWAADVLPVTALGCGFVLSDDGRRDPAAFADRDALSYGPGADAGAVLATGSGPRGGEPAPA